jgi:hypothetical protein
MHQRGTRVSGSRKRLDQGKNFKEIGGSGSMKVGCHELDPKGNTGRHSVSVTVEALCSSALGPTSLPLKQYVMAEGLLAAVPAASKEGVNNFHQHNFELIALCPLSQNLKYLQSLMVC